MAFLLQFPTVHYLHVGIDFCTLILHLADLLVLLVSSRIFFVDLLLFFTYTIMSSVNKENLMFLFPNLYAYYFFFLCYNTGYYNF